MPKISTYTLDTQLTGDEKLLASAASTNETVNISLSDANNYIWNNVVKVPNQTDRLALSPQVGAIVFQEDTEVLYIYKTSGWVIII